MNRTAFRLRPIRAFAALFVLLAALPAAAEPALWRLADEDTEITFFGSIHILPPDSEWRSDEMEAAFAAADTVVLEAPLDGAAQEAAAQMAARNASLPRGVTLSSLLDPEDAAFLVPAAQRAGLSPANLQPLRPWMASLALSLGFAQATGMDPDSGVDRVLLVEGRQDGKALSYLERAEDQIALFVNLSEDAETGMLIATMREIVETPDMLDDMQDAWLAGDQEGLAAIALDGMEEETPELYASAVLARNAAWTDQIAAMMDAPGRVFIVVGAAHLTGADSVLEMLAARGLAAERVR